MSRIVKITCYESKTGAGTPLERAELVSGFGISGDFYAQKNAGRGERQISLLSQAAREFIDAHKNEDGLCFARFKENLTYDGDLPDALAVGSALAIGEAVVTIAEEKRCFAECALFQRSSACPLSSCGWFAEVITGGIVRIGDEIKIVEAKD